MWADSRLTKMKAILQESYGPPDEVLRLGEVDEPVIADDEVLVRVRGASVHPDVWHVVAGRPWVVRLMGVGLRRPKHPVPGTDLAGEVVAVGGGVTRFAVGDEVFGESHREFQWRHGGAFAEYAAVPEEVLAEKPAGITFAQAAAVPTSGIIAVHCLEGRDLQGRIEAGWNVLINGAGGGVGTFAVQLAKARGARVVGVDAAHKLATIRTLGADRVVDYAEEDPLRLGERYDLIVDVASNLRFADCKRALTAGGKYLCIGHDHYGRVGGRAFGGLPGFFKLFLMSPFVRQLPDLGFALPAKRDTMALLKRLLDGGELTPVVDRTYPLGEVAEAMRYLQSGRACGKVVLTP